jgi:RES domain-containing protein
LVKFRRLMAESIPMTPHPEAERLARALARCDPLADEWAGFVYRSSSPEYAGRDDLITGAGAKETGGRWNPKGSFHAVYASLDFGTAAAEVMAHNRRFRIPEHMAMPRLFAALEVQLTRVLDLRRGPVRSALKVSADRLTAEEWWKLQKRGKEAVTQAVGRLAWHAKWQALLVPSAARPGGANLIVFPANLEPPDSWLRIHKPYHLPPRPSPI